MRISPIRRREEFFADDMGYPVYGARDILLAVDQPFEFFDSSGF
jgi:hypothetical protein